MSETVKLFSVGKVPTAEFPYTDNCGGYYKLVSKAELEQLRNNAAVVYVKDRYFATSLTYLAESAYARLRKPLYSTSDNLTGTKTVSGAGDVKRETAAADYAPGIQYVHQSPHYEPTYYNEDDSVIYRNPGKLLKTLASIFFVIEAIAALILAFVLESFWVFLGGAVVSYLSGLTLAAFGDLVISAKEISRKLNRR